MGSDARDDMPLSGGSFQYDARARRQGRPGGVSGPRRGRMWDMPTKVSRNEPCPCGSGKKYKHCCITKDERADALWGEREYVAEKPTKPRDPWSPHFSKGASAPNDGKVVCRAIAPPKPEETYREDAHDFAGPPNYQKRRPLDYTKPITRIEVHYVFEEFLGRAEVTYHFPVKQLILVEPDCVVQAGQLRPGMQFRIESGEIATVTRVGQSKLWDAPPPAQEGELCRRRIVGTVERVSFSVMDLVIAGIKITTTPGHRFWSATHDDWRPAAHLRAGESLRSPVGELVPIEHVSAPRQEPIKVYNLEIEQYNNYFVGGETQSVWVHNGLAGGCGVPKPVEVADAEIGAKLYKKGWPGAVVEDHRLSRAVAKVFGGDPHAPSNLVLEAFEANARKGAREGQLLSSYYDYVRRGLRPEEALEVLRPELQSIINDVHARPVDPNVFRFISAEGSR